MDKEYLSKEKLEALKTELNTLKTVRRQEVAKQLEFAKSLGDLSENAEYHAARDEQADIEDRIRQIEDMLKRAVIIESHHSNKVEVGTSVNLKRKDKKEAETFLIVGSEEADALKNKISNNSPLGSALLGKQKGDQIVVNTPRGKMEYTIVEVK